MPNAVQDAVGVLCCKCTLQAHVHVGVHKDCQGLFCRADPRQSALLPYWCMGYSSSGAGLASSLCYLHENPVSPFLQPTKVPLSGSMPRWCINHSSCSFTSSESAIKIAEGALSLLSRCRGYLILILVYKARRPVHYYSL